MSVNKLMISKVGRRITGLQFRKRLLIKRGSEEQGDNRGETEPVMLGLSKYQVVGAIKNNLYNTQDFFI